MSLTHLSKLACYAPFAVLQGIISLAGVFIASLILTTQRRDNEIASHREQLTLELSILAEQKAAKIIGLLEELRRDLPSLPVRIDKEAEALFNPPIPRQS